MISMGALLKQTMLNGAAIEDTRKVVYQRVYNERTNLHGTPT